MTIKQSTVKLTSMSQKPCEITNSDHPALSSGELQKLTTKDQARHSNRLTETTQNVSGNPMTCINNANHMKT